MLTPARRRGIEYLDDPRVDPAVRARSLGDVARSNRWLGGRRAVLHELRSILPTLPDDAILLDVGTGDADLPHAARGAASRRGVRLRTIGVDEAPSLLANARARGRIADALRADARALPLADRSVDVVLCSQLLHHFTREDALAVLAELHRVARRHVVVSDLRRSWIAAAGFWAVSFPFRFHPVTRHDGVVSVLRGFTGDELRAMVCDATGVRPRVARRLGFRLIAHWTP